MSADYEKRMLRVLEHIHENPAGDLSLDALADIAAMSRFHWHRVFHAMTGETCAQAVRRIRMYRAAEMLVKTDLPVGEVATRVGYPGAQSFGRAFREAFGMPPARFGAQRRMLAPQLLSRKEPRTRFAVDVETAPDRVLYGLAHRGPYPSLGRTFENLATMTKARGLSAQIQARIGVYFDDPAIVPYRALRSFAGVDLDGGAAPDGLETVRLSGGPVARLRYRGPYSGLHVAYSYLFGLWLPRSGRDPADHPVFECYITSPTEAAPHDLITDICLRLKP